MEQSSSSSDYSGFNGYIMDLSSKPSSIVSLSLSKAVYIVILFLAFIVILLHAVVGVSMTSTIFLFVLYGALLGFVSYIKYQYIPK